MKKTMVAVLTVIIMLTNNASASTWKTQQHQDLITGNTVQFATSAWASPANPLNFPYHNLESLLGVGDNGERRWAYINFTQALTPTGGEYRNGRLYFTLRINVDGQPGSMTFVNEPSGLTLHAIDSDQMIQKIVEGNTLILEIPIIQNQPAYFKYSLKGSSKAINSL